MATNRKALISPTFKKQDEFFLFVSLMMVTSLFLPWSGHHSPFDYLRMTQSSFSPWHTLWAITLVTPLFVRVPMVRPWLAILAAFTFAYVLSALNSDSFGAQIAYLFAALSLLTSANPAVVQATDFAIRRNEAQTAEVYNHTATVVPGVHFSAQEFYGAIETAINERQWPGVQVLRVFTREAGLLSHKREYLRVIRQRQVFDVCASTFGKDYFFSFREAMIIPPISWATFCILLVLVAFVFKWMVNIAGLIGGSFAFFTFICVTLFLMFNALKMGLTRIDSFLMRLPVIGPIYEVFIRRSYTYFQHDARMVFLTLMDELLKGHLAETSSAKGIELLSLYEHKPLLDGYYTRRELSTMDPRN